MDFSLEQHAIASFTRLYLDQVSQSVATGRIAFVEKTVKTKAVKYRVPLPLVLGWLICWCFSGCTEPVVPTHENVLTRQERLTSQLGIIFDSIKDQESAEAARPKLVAAQRESNEIGELMRMLGPPSDKLKEMTKERRAKWEMESFELHGRRMAAISRYPELQSMIDSIKAELETGNRGK